MRLGNASPKTPFLRRVEVDDQGDVLHGHAKTRLFVEPQLKVALGLLAHRLAKRCHP